jgi:hypothetical protein
LTKIELGKRVEADRQATQRGRLIERGAFQQEIEAVLKSLALWERDESYGKAARFWARIFAINFAMGVVTGIPMEFQFGTNWAAFSSAGGIIGQTLAMEGGVTTI